MLGRFDGHEPRMEPHVVAAFTRSHSQPVCHPVITVRLRQGQACGQKGYSHVLQDRCGMAAARSPSGNAAQDPCPLALPWAPKSGAPCRAHVHGLGGGNPAMPPVAWPGRLHGGVRALSRPSRRASTSAARSCWVFGNAPGFCIRCGARKQDADGCRKARSGHGNGPPTRRRRRGKCCRGAPLPARVSGSILPLPDRLPDSVPGHRPPYGMERQIARQQPSGRVRLRNSQPNRPPKAVDRCHPEFRVWPDGFARRNVSRLSQRQSFGKS